MDALSANDEAEAAAKASRKFVIRLYSSKNEICDNLDDLRLKLALTKNASLAKLPPCEKSFLQHVKHASWQAKIWAILMCQSLIWVHPSIMGENRKDIY